MCRFLCTWHNILEDHIILDCLDYLIGYETQIDALAREKTNIKRDFEVKVENMRTDKESLSNSLTETRDAKRQADILQREVQEKNTVIERLQVVRSTLENERNTFKKEANVLRSQLNTLKDQERANRDEIQVPMAYTYHILILSPLFIKLSK